MPRLHETYFTRKKYHLEQMKESLINKDVTSALTSFRKAEYNSLMIDRELGIQKRTPKELYEIANGPSTYSFFFSVASKVIDQILNDKEMGKRLFKGK